MKNFIKAFRAFNLKKGLFNSVTLCYCEESNKYSTFIDIPKSRLMLSFRLTIIATHKNNKIKTNYK